MNVNRLRIIRILYVEIYETINNLNPDFLTEIFALKETKRATREQYKLNLERPEYDQKNVAAKVYVFLGPKLGIVSCIVWSPLKI